MPAPNSNRRQPEFQPGSIAGRSAFIRKLRHDGNNWNTAWEKTLAKYPRSLIANCKKVWEEETRAPKADNRINSKRKTGGKLAFVEAHLTAKGENRKTKSEIAALYMKEFPGVSEKTAIDTVRWAAWKLKKRTGRDPNHLPTAR